VQVRAEPHHAELLENWDRLQAGKRPLPCIATPSGCPRSARDRRARKWHAADRIASNHQLPEIHDIELICPACVETET